jgi:hypothetical protein
MNAEIKESFWRGPIRTESHSDTILKWTASAFVIFSLVLVLRTLELAYGAPQLANSKYVILGTVIFCVELLLFMAVPAYFLVKARSRIAALSLVLTAIVMAGVAASLYWPEVTMVAGVVNFLRLHHDLRLITPSELLPRLLLDSLWPITTLGLLFASWRALSATNVLRKLKAEALAVANRRIAKVDVALDQVTAKPG